MTSRVGEAAVNAKKHVATGMLTDGARKASAIRLMSFVSLGASICFGWITVTTKNTGATGVYMTRGLLLGRFAPKALQKHIGLHAAKGAKLREG